MLNKGLGHAQYLTAVTISTQQVNIWSSEPTSVLLFFSLLRINPIHSSEERRILLSKVEHRLSLYALRGALDSIPGQPALPFIRNIRFNRAVTLSLFWDSIPTEIFMAYHQQLIISFWSREPCELTWTYYLDYSSQAYQMNLPKIEFCIFPMH